MPKLSVIIPIYNTENYLYEALKSLQKQSFSDFEAILVDDGSTDQSAEICQMFVQNDPRFSYYHQENRGSSSARNVGFSHAIGEYVAFLDSDDTLKEDCFSHLFAAMNETPYDLVVSGIETVRGGKVLYTLVLPEQTLNGREYQRYVLSRQMPIFLFQSTCNKLYRRKWFLEKGVQFDEQSISSEDSLFNTELLVAMTPEEKVMCVSYCDYRYRWDNTNSIQRSKKTFDKVQKSIVTSMQTIAIRKKIAESFPDDTDVQKGIKQAHAIVAICNAQLIETNDFAAAERTTLYSAYLDDISYDITDIYKEYAYTDCRILQYTMKKQPRGIHRVYKLRRLKKALLSVLRK